jgi:NodT family efflux transporter outer membrane factor (OMF) lipoprotein
MEPTDSGDKSFCRLTDKHLEASCSARCSRLVLTACIALAIGGCTTVGPDFKHPETASMESWIERGENAIKAAPTDLRNWWKVFNDPTLDLLVEKALDQNLSLQITGLRIIEARAQLGIVRGALYPQTQTAGGSAAKQRISKNSPNYSQAAKSSFSVYQAGFDAAWEIDFWGRYRRGLEAADANMESSVAAYQQGMVSLTAEVASTYINIRTFEERIKLAENNVKLQQQSLHIAQVRFDNGATTELDVQQAKSNLAGTQALIPGLVKGLRQAKHSLSILLGMVPGEVNQLLVGPSVIPVAPAETAVGIPAELLRRRPDVRQAEFSAALESARIGIAEADLYPSFSLFGSIGLQTSSTNDSSLGDFTNSDSLAYSIGPGFNWNIFNYGRLKNSVRAQDAAFQQQLVNYQNTVLRAYQETEDAIVGFLQSKQEARYFAESAKAAQRSADLANVQYREGAVDFQRVVDSERTLVIQQDKETEARGSIVLNLVSTYKALGGGWETEKDRQLIPEQMEEAMRERSDWGDILPTEQLPDGLELPAPAKEQPLFPPIDW